MKRSPYITNLLEQKSGRELRLSADCEFLALDIESVTGEHIVVRRGSFYVIYGVDCRAKQTLDASNIGEILSVAGDTFTARKGSFISTYDKTGKKLSVRTVR